MAQLSNLAVMGEKPSTHLIAPGKAWARNHIHFRLSGWEVDLFQRPAAFEQRSKLRGRWVHTTTVYVRDVTPGLQTEAERLVTDLSHLLSFATMSEVRPFSFSLSGHSRRWHRIGRVSAWRSPIEPDGKAIADFVRKVWVRYRKLKRTRRLAELIHYLTLTDLPGQPLEVRILIAFVALENMKASWARSSSIPYRQGRFLKSVSGTGKTKRVPYKLEELLQLMFGAVKMRPALKRIVRVRNEIVHLGVTSRSFRANQAYYERTKGIEHEYLLRLLGYNGVFHDYRTNSSRVIRSAT